MRRERRVPHLRPRRPDLRRTDLVHARRGRSQGRLRVLRSAARTRVAAKTCLQSFPCIDMLAGMAKKKAPTRNVKRLTDPRALRALAHPIRLELVGLLRRLGPLTATQAAELIGESSGSTSFHLRQLAKYGLVEDAGGGAGRERPWRA